MTNAQQPSIQHLLQTLCPDGVEYATLGEVCKTSMGEFVRKDKQNPNGKYPVYNGGSTNTGYYDDYNTEANKVIISARGAGAGFINKIDTPFWAGNSCYVLSVIDTEKLNWVYLYYALKNQENSIINSQQKGGGVPAVSKKQVESLPIPLPPLPIQERIVEILDKFSRLSAELEAELELRKKQYDFYRNRLLSFDSNSDTNTTEHYHKGYYPLLVKYQTLGEIGTMTKGNGIQKSNFQAEGYPCIHYGQVHTCYGTFTYKTKSFISEDLAQKCKKAHTGDLIIATTSEDVEACCKSTAWLGEGDVAVSGDAHIFSHNQNPKYIAYLFQTEMFRQQKKKVATGTKVIRVSGDSILRFTFPLPPLPVQERIVGILDKFETLVSDLSQGLPAEINLVQKQYEYYRNQLLTF